MVNPKMSITMNLENIFSGDIKNEKWKDYMKAIPTDDGKTIYSCTLCLHSLKLSRSIKDHIEGMHLGFKDTCLHCGNNFFSTNSLRKHMSDKHSGWAPIELKCPQCSYTTSMLKSLRTHLTVSHHVNRELAQPQKQAQAQAQAGQENVEPEAWLAYAAIDEDELKPNRCTACDKSYCNRRVLREHIEAQHLKILRKCNKCSYATIHAGGLRYHKRNSHNPQRKHCSYCAYSALTKSRLNGHLSKVHNITVREEAVSPKKTAKTKKKKKEPKNIRKNTPTNTSKSTRKNTPKVICKNNLKIKIKLATPEPSAPATSQVQGASGSPEPSSSVDLQFKAGPDMSQALPSLDSQSNAHSDVSQLSSPEFYETGQDMFQSLASQFEDDANSPESDISDLLMDSEFLTPSIENSNGGFDLINFILSDNLEL